MTEDLKDTSPPVETRHNNEKSDQEILVESKERTAIYEGSRVAQVGRENLAAFVNNNQSWEGVPLAEPYEHTTEHARHAWSLQKQKKILDSGGDLLIQRGEIRHQALLPDDYGMKVPELAYEFRGVGFSAHFALDQEGNPTRTIVYEVPSDTSKPRRIELFTRSGSLEAISGTPAFDTIEKELATEIGKGIRPAPKEPTEQEAITKLNEQAQTEAVAQTFGDELKDIRNLPETPENNN